MLEADLSARTGALPAPIAAWDAASTLAELSCWAGALAVGSTDRGAAGHTGSTGAGIAQLPGRTAALLIWPTRAATNACPIDVTDLPGRTTALLIWSARTAGNTGAVGAELTRRARALAVPRAPGLALAAHAELSARTRTLPSASAARNADVFAIADLAGRTAALAGAARATYPDLTLTIDADLVGQTAGAAAGNVGGRTGILTDAIETGLSRQTDRDAGAIHTALADAAVGVEAALPTPAAPAVDALLAKGTVDGSPALRRLGAGSAAAPPCAPAALVAALGAVLSRGLVITTTETERTQDGGETDTQGAASEGASGLILG